VSEWVTRFEKAGEAPPPSLPRFHASSIAQYHEYCHKNIQDVCVKQSVASLFAQNQYSNNCKLAAIIAAPLRSKRIRQRAVFPGQNSRAF
jgi:hypothetical protein